MVWTMTRSIVVARAIAEVGIAFAFVTREFRTPFSHLSGALDPSEGTFT
jgi:hypothetical protein